MSDLTLGFSPCPNDTFIFHALIHGLVPLPDLTFTSRLEDVETLNRLALVGELDVAKVSYGALPYLLDDYVLLRSGGALGHACGPLVVARRPEAVRGLDSVTIAIPGRYTTANLLLRLFQPGAIHTVEMPYDRIMPAVRRGEVDAGLIIHESRLTYPDHGLVKLVDLGEWWESVTGRPIPLGAIVARRSLGDRIPAIERVIRGSVEYAFANPRQSAAYVATHASELSDAVTRSHIDLYVTPYTVALGPEGESAVHELLRRASEAGLQPRCEMDLFSVSSTI